MEQRNKDFILDIRDKMNKSGITEACLSYMKTHPQMFNNTRENRKVMSIMLSVAIVCEEKEIPTDPGFITITLGKDNDYSEHFKSNRKYWNGEEEETNDQNM